MVKIRSLLTVLMFPILALSASINKNSDGKYSGQTALYWGQASAQQQNRLRYYCDSDSVDILLLAFITEFPNSQSSSHGYTLNLANACFSETYSSQESTPNCTQVGDDIKYCQSLGKKVLLSLGGESGEYGFTSDYEGSSFADILWNSFGGSSEYTKDERPFGDAIVDGFDFDFENEKQTGYVSLAKRLQELSSNDTSKDYILTSAPQCPFPDQSNGDIIDNVELDYLFVQFYNNKCGLSEDFNFDQWAEYIQSKEYEKTKLFIGLPANNNSASSGYVESDVVLSRIDEIWNNETLKELFGGVMFWDASQVFGYSTTSINNIEDNILVEVSKSFQKETTNQGSSSGATVTTSNSTTNVTSTKKNEGRVLKASSFLFYFALQFVFFISL